MRQTIDVYGIGNAIVDLQLQVEDHFLAALGITKGVMTLVDAETQGKVLTALEGKPINRCSGGSACNTVVGVADFGGSAAYACKVGADERGHFYLNELKDLGIAADSQPTGGVTGTSVILITPDAQRTMLTHLGASTGLATDDIDPVTIGKAHYLYVEGYLFASPGTQAAAIRAIELAKEEGVLVALTVSDPFLITLCRDTFWELIKGPVDLLFCNQEEARALTGESDPVKAAHTIHRHSSNVALTLGKEGSIIMESNKLHPIEAATVTAVDTTGAGDMYAAGVLYGITNGLTWKQAGHLGSQAAGMIVSRMGARLGRRFSQAEIRKLLG